MNARAAALEAIRYAFTTLAAEDADNTPAILESAAQARSAANLALYLDPQHPDVVRAERWTEIAESIADPIRYKPKETA